MIAVEKRPTQPDLFATDRWPRRPYCSDDLEYGVRIRSLSAALKKPYIQANPPYLRVWSIFDVDRIGGAVAWEDAMLPPPSWATVNKENGHAHLVWGLSAPVLVDSPDMRQAPLRYLCAVEAAFRARLQADSGYSGLITKNPAHPLWRTLRGPQMAYELGELADWVDLPKHVPRRKPEEVGVGRNVTVFDWLRQYAYRHIKHYKFDVRNFVYWQSHLNNKALERNGDLRTPMDGREVWHIAKSVSKWTWRSFDIEASDARFSALQAHRGAMGGKVGGSAGGKKGMLSRWGDNEDKQASARLMAAKGMSTRAIAVELGVSQKTASRWTSSK
ncbi:replication initiation protein [Laribacter hongkongensis]|uniref:replication initiation protein n=1 Tax=Laribacter hongkongensis TaxID=168471 RepID=UPI001EFCC0CA|nr:replication initiation protein [Laribacter hongkongensis]MCG9066324.1 replication initiation protein [Laribacter hongkongensis]